MIFSISLGLAIRSINPGNMGRVAAFLRVRVIYLLLLGESVLMIPCILKSICHCPESCSYLASGGLTNDLGVTPNNTDEKSGSTGP